MLFILSMGVIICLQDDITISDDQETVDSLTLFFDVIKKLHQGCRIHALLFRSRRLPERLPCPCFCAPCNPAAGQEHRQGQEDNNPYRLAFLVHLLATRSCAQGLTMADDEMCPVQTNTRPGAQPKRAKSNALIRPTQPLRLGRTGLILNNRA